MVGIWTAAALIPPPFWGGDGAWVSKNATKLSYCFKVAFFFVRHPLSCYKPLTVFQSSDKVDSNNFFLFFNVFLWGNESLELSTLPFCQCHSHSKINHFILLERFKRLLQFQNWRKLLWSCSLVVCNPSPQSTRGSMAFPQGHSECLRLFTITLLHFHLLFRVCHYYFYFF